MEAPQVSGIQDKRRGGGQCVHLRCVHASKSTLARSLEAALLQHLLQFHHTQFLCKVVLSLHTTRQANTTAKASS